MSRAQGDGYRTHTDHELNAYKWRLIAKRERLIDHKEKWYRVGDGWILAQEQNRMTNPNGSWKWNGWEVEAHEYWITVFPEECVKLEDGQPRAIGWAQAVKVIDDDKNQANAYLLQKHCKAACEGLKNLDPTGSGQQTGIRLRGKETGRDNHDRLGRRQLLFHLGGRRRSEDEEQRERKLEKGSGSDGCRP